MGHVPALGAAAAPVTVAAAPSCHRCPRRPPPSPLVTLVLTGGDAGAGEVSGEGLGVEGGRGVEGVEGGE